MSDRRGVRPGGLVVGGGIGALVLAAVALFLGVDPSELLGNDPAQAAEGPVAETVAEADLRELVSVVLADTEDVWNALLDGYVEPQLVLFREAVRSACGTQGSAVGPFYCSGDHTVYLDLRFLAELDARLDAPGDFAQAYVIGHEVGHHVQNLLGTFAEVAPHQARAGEREANELSVRMELQADFYAGVYAHHAQRMLDVLEPGDVPEALNAASSIGDDVLQARGPGVVRPETFTHGTAEQRRRWFLRGYESGDPSQGDTFSPAYEDL